MKYFFIITILSISMVSCLRSIESYPIGPIMRAEMPYNDGQIVKFLHNQEIISCAIETSSLWVEYGVQHKGNERSNEHELLFATLKPQNGHKIWKMTRLTLSPSKLEIDGITSFSTGKAETEDSKLVCTSSCLDSLTVANRTYKRVFVRNLAINTTDLLSVKTLYYSPEGGILKVITQDNSEYTLIP